MHPHYRSRRWAVSLLLFALAISASCARRDYRIPQTLLDTLPAHAEITGVPFYPQDTHQCGPASLTTVLTWSGSTVTLEKITSEIYTPGRQGSLQPLLISAARHHSRLPYVIRDFEALVKEVATGHPVVVLQNLGLSWYPLWHYAVVIGYDSEKHLVLLRSGKVFKKEIGWSLFLRTWERADKWGLVVLPLTEVPASADEGSYLGAVAALEKLRNYEAASVGYETALKRWPTNLGATIGLGNTRHAMGDVAGAEEAFRRAVELCHTCGDAFNNLAHVLAQQRRYDEALDAAHRAVRLGGPNETTYRAT